MMRRIHAGLHPRALAMDAEGVGPLGGMVLMAVADEGSVSIAALTADMGRDKSQMTRLVQMLEGKGLIVRAADPTDRRVSVLSLTPEGRDFVQRIEVVLSETLDDVLAPLSAEERTQFARLVAKL